MSNSNFKMKEKKGKNERKATSKQIQGQSFDEDVKIWRKMLFLWNINVLLHYKSIMFPFINYITSDR